MMAAAPMVAAPIQMAHGYPAPLATVAAIQGATPYPRRDGLPPEYRRDTRVAFPLNRSCYACNTPGHESWFCPLKKLREDPNAYLNQQQWDILQHIVKARQEGVVAQGESGPDCCTLTSRLQRGSGSSESQKDN
eukprot:jgi/Botrbrau1/747/Bobra.0181s0006.1